MAYQQSHWRAKSQEIVIVKQYSSPITKQPNPRRGILPPANLRFNNIQNPKSQLFFPKISPNSPKIKQPLLPILHVSSPIHPRVPLRSSGRIRRLEIRFFFFDFVLRCRFGEIAAVRREARSRDDNSEWILDLRGHGEREIPVEEFERIKSGRQG